MDLVSRDRAAATEDLKEINERYDTQLDHVNEIRDAIQRLIDMPDLNLYPDSDSEQVQSKADAAFFRDKST